VLRWTERDDLDPAWAEGLLGPGALFELVETDVLGQPVEVFAQRPRSVPQILTRAADTYGDRPYLIGADRTITYADAPARVAAIAATFRRDHGVRPGDRVALAGEFTIDHALTLWAVAATGAIVVAINPHATDDERAHALALTEPVLVLSGPEFAELVAASDTASDTASHTPDDTPDVVIDEDDPFAIVFTSGTTGRPKGATLSHRNTVHFSLAAAATSAVRSIVHQLPPSAAPATVIGSAPLFHVSGLLGQLTNGAFWGMTIVLPPPGRWDATTHLELSERHRVTSWSIVPTQLWRLIDHPQLDDYDLSALEMVGGGGATFEPELLRRTAERLPHTATALRVGYGMTETAGTVTLLQPPVADDVAASVGTAVAGTYVEIREPEASGDGDPGAIGEIWVRGAQVFLGYWNDDEATAAALDAERWYATGDFGRITDGHLFLESRRRDLIIRGGENIYPIEIENRLVEHPAIAEAAVVGIEHRELGQQVKAVCVRRDGATITDDEVRAWVAETLARYKVPTVVEFRDELPRTETGKVRKIELT